MGLGGEERGEGGEGEGERRRAGRGGSPHKYGERTLGKSVVARPAAPAQQRPSRHVLLVTETESQFLH